MRLRTIIGAAAGEVHEYAYLAGMAALQAGTAEHVSRPRVPTLEAESQAFIVDPDTTGSVRMNPVRGRRR